MPVAEGLGRLLGVWHPQADAEDKERDATLGFDCRQMSRLAPSGWALGGLAVARHR